MLRSLYSAVSGVKAHQTYLDVTGNNIANVNTVGFKRDVVGFRDMIYQDMKSASAPNNAVPIGGVNPAQVGLGVAVGSIETVHTGGSMQNTGIPTDMAISGRGFFVVQNGSQTLYTRAGNFAMDRDGNLVMSGNGYRVQGYAYKNQYDPATGEMTRVRDTNLSGINIPVGEKIPARATTLAAFRCNLCSTSTPEIANLNNIPGGADAVKRPHEYNAYGSNGVDYIDTQANIGTTGIANGATLYDTGDGKVYKFNLANATWNEVRDADPYDVFYAKGDPMATPPYSQVYDSPSGLTGTVLKRDFVDFVGTAAPADGIDIPTKAGQTWLNTADGKIYTAKSDLSGWQTTTKQATADTVYACKNDGMLYAFDSTGAYDAAFADTTIMDPANSYNLFTWDGTSRSWTNMNLSGLRVTENSVATQETITEFGKSIMAGSDHEDKFYVYDSLGNPYTMIVKFRKVAEYPATSDPANGAESEWDWYAYYVDEDGKQMPQYGQGAGTFIFGDDGLLKETYYYEPTPRTPDPMATPDTAPVYDWTVVKKVVGDPAYDNVATGKVVADFNVSGAQGKAVDGEYLSNVITLDFLGKDYAKTLGLDSEPIDGVTQYASTSTTKLKAQDGYAMGELSTWSVGQDGTINGVYTNGRTLPIAQVALAMFANEQGLQKVGETCFAETVNSGIAQVGQPMVGGAGSIQGNTIEMSNVDLSEEFVNLIRAQRGFQANTRVVTTSDQILEELINLKR